jgi:hypothetical protein
MSEETGLKKYVGYIKDAAYVIGIVISLMGWVHSETVNKTNMENKVEVLSKAVESNTKQIEKMNELFMEQNKLNGSIIQYMAIKK